MKKNWKIFLFVFFLVPSFTSAQVLINEIAWMGTETSANDEWIELKNTSTSTVDISAWVLESQDGSPKINLSGSISAGGFFLLERTDDFSVLNIRADQIYSGALSNSGEILLLKDGSGREIDKVDGRDNWALGGDNNKKLTLQKTASAWITASSTPKAENAKEDEVLEEGGEIELKAENTASEAETNSDNKADSEISSVFQDKIFVKANAGVNIVAEAGQKIFFDASGSEGEDLSFSWNLGNGETKKGKSFLYTYKFPGKYLVTLFVRSGSYLSQDQIDVTVYPAGVLISEFYVGKSNGDGWIELHNTSDNFIDLSFWKILSESKEFSIPDGTFLAPLAYLVFSEDILGENFFENSKKLSLLYPNNQASDIVSYEFKDAVFSASRKNKKEFIWTKNKTPGFKNIIAKPEPSMENKEQSNVKSDIGVSSDLLKKNWASFVLFGGEKSFLIKPAKAEVVGVEDEGVLPQVLDKMNISANLSSVSSLNLFFIFLAGMITSFGAFLLGKKRS